MRKSRLESLLHDYARNDLPDEERREVEKRIATDAKARALLEEVRSAQDALRLLRERPEPPRTARDVFPSIQAAIASQAFEPRPRLALEGLGTRYYRRLAIAATLLFAVTVGYVSFLAKDRVVTPSSPDAPFHPVVRARSAVELGSLREGISAEEFFRLLDEARDPDELTVRPVQNVMRVAEAR